MVLQYLVPQRSLLRFAEKNECALGHKIFVLGTTTELDGEGSLGSFFRFCPGKLLKNSVKTGL